MKRALWVGAGCGGVALLGTVCVGLGALVGFPFVVEAALVSALEERGLDCSPLDVTAGAGTATLGPTSCRMATGPVERVELPDGVTVSLTGVAPGEATLGRALVELRPAQHTGRGQWSGPLGPVEGALAALQNLFVDSASMSSRPLLDLEAEEIQLSRGGVAVATLRSVTWAEPDGRRRLTMRQLEVPSGPLLISQLTADITPSRIDAAGAVQASLQVFMLQVQSPAVPVVVTGEGLDTEAPSFSVALR